jgi:hypothetical protein
VTEEPLRFVLVAFRVVIKVALSVMAVSTLADDWLRRVELVLAAPIAVSTLAEEPESWVDEV